MRPAVIPMQAERCEYEYQIADYHYDYCCCSTDCAGMYGKKRTISLRYALPWTLLAIGVTVLTCFPVLTDRLTNLLGVSLPVNMIFFMGFCFSLVIIFSLSLAVSRLSKRVKALAQHQALLERTMQEMQMKEMKIKEQADE